MVVAVQQCGGGATVVVVVAVQQGGAVVRHPSGRGGLCVALRCVMGD